MLLANGTLFVPINKTGSTTVRRAILDNCRHQCSYIAQIWSPEQHLRERANQYHGHYHLRELKPQLGNALKHLWVYTIVRNPWERFVSWYAWRREDRRGSTFGEFLIRLLTRPNQGRTPVLQSSYLKDEFDYIGGLETIEADWRVISKRIGLPQVQLGHHNRGPIQINWRNYYTPELINRVGEMERPVIELKGYTFED